MDIHRAYEQAVQLHVAGRIAEAEPIYRAILAQQPNHPDALHMLGLAFAQSGRPDIAADLIVRAVSIDPSVAAYHSNLAAALISIGEQARAADSARAALALTPEYPDALNNLGNALRGLHQIDDAIAAHRQAISIRPDFAEAHYNLATTLKQRDAFIEAIDAYRNTLRIRPDLAIAQHELGICLHKIGRSDEAIDALTRATQMDPHNARTFSDLGGVLIEQWRYDESIAATRTAVQLDPNHALAWFNLAAALHFQDQLEAAQSAYREALRCDPNLAVARSNLGALLISEKQYDAATSELTEALRLDPTCPATFSGLAAIASDEGRVADALSYYRRAVELAPEDPITRGAFLYTLHLDPNTDARTNFEQHQRYAAVHAEPLRGRMNFVFKNDPNPTRRLKIGIISPDFSIHAVGHFIEPLLAHHDKEQLEIVCYSDVRRPDATTARLKELADSWCDSKPLTHEQLAKKIADDRIDILIDLAGHTRNNRMLVFARRPAPIQITYLGYPGTTGLNTIDYRLTDALADPPGLTDKFCTEELIRLPRTAWCYQPPAVAPPVAPAPSMEKGYVTFGSFNNLAKFNPPLAEVWARILTAVPSARLILKSAPFSSVATRARVLDEFARFSIAPDRLDLITTHPSTEDHLASYAQIDIALDTFPYNGTTTTCDALWMGVPVIGLAGNAHAGRVGVSLLTNIGCAELIGESVDKYVEIATELARDQMRLTDLRGSLREKMSRSPLTDGKGFSRDFESALRQIWRRWRKANANT